MERLALTYRRQGRRKDAKELETQVKETRHRVLSAEHPPLRVRIGSIGGGGEGGGAGSTTGCA